MHFSTGKQSSSSHISTRKRSFYQEFLGKEKPFMFNSCFPCSCFKTTSEPVPGFAAAQTSLHLVEVCCQVSPLGGSTRTPARPELGNTSRLALNVFTKPLNSRRVCSWSISVQANCKPCLGCSSGKDLNGKFSTFCERAPVSRSLPAPSLPCHFGHAAPY